MGAHAGQRPSVRLHRASRRPADAALLWGAGIRHRVEAGECDKLVVDHRPRNAMLLFSREMHKLTHPPPGAAAGGFPVCGVMLERSTNSN
ncbi:hypothetical protein ACH4PR_53845 [Streptomyces mirabilis]|uniref:hypothetical protein n=1 Tax=Streptomyces mirabilis TaxID=68239 RepID=UPI00378BBC1E